MNREKTDYLFTWLITMETVGIIILTLMGSMLLFDGNLVSILIFAPLMFVGIIYLIIWQVDSYLEWKKNERHYFQEVHHE